MISQGLLPNNLDVECSEGSSKDDGPWASNAGKDVKGARLDCHELMRGFKLTVSQGATSNPRATRLVSQAYQRCGYVSELPTQVVESIPVSNQGIDKRTTTFFLEDDQGRSAASISLVADSVGGLPADLVFNSKLRGLRECGRSLIEVTRLTVAKDCGGSKLLLGSLFDLVNIFAREVIGADDLIIEVNPRHANFYMRQFFFEAWGSPQACPRVNGAPAALLRLDFTMFEGRLVRLLNGCGLQSQRYLAESFLNRDRALRIATCLKKALAAIQSGAARDVE